MVVSTRNVSRSAPTMAAPLPFAAAQTMAAPTMAAPTMMAAPAMATPFGYGYNPMTAGFMQQQAMMAPIMMMPPQAPTAASLAAAGLTDALKGVLTNVWQIPTKTFIEKEGTFINFQGTEQKIKAAITIVEEALSLVEAGQLMRGQELDSHLQAPQMTSLKYNHFTLERGDL